MLFREFQTLHPTVILMFLAGMLLTFLGVYAAVPTPAQAPRAALYVACNVSS